jgi:hypothetical protein
MLFVEGFRLSLQNITGHSFHNVIDYINKPFTSVHLLPVNNVGFIAFFINPAD